MHFIRRLIPVSAAIASLAVLAAGCGASTKTSTTGSSSSKTSQGNFVQQAYRYSACMRNHGVANFPDPQVSHTSGGTQISIHAEPGSPQFASAQQACRGILPAPSKADLAQQAADQRRRTQNLVSFAHCLRTHGITNFPDPSATGGLSLSEIQADGIDLQAPSTRAAALACVPASNGQVTRAAVLQATSANPQQNGSGSSTGAASSNP